MRKRLTEKEAIGLLKKYSPDKKSLDAVLAHSMAVQRIALRIARKVPKADIEFIRVATILHDIGRFKYKPGNKDMIKHGIEGAKILLNKGIDKSFANVCERHLGCGINKKDIKEQKLPLPIKCYVPYSINEKIISYADSLVFGSREGTKKEVVNRYRKELGERYAERFKKQHEEIMRLIGKEKEKN